jgi:rod shape-determining protein MreC
MASRSEPTPDYLGGVRRVLFGTAVVLLVGLFLLWRIDNARVEQLRVSLVDQFVPSFAWTAKPIAVTARMLADFRAYGRVYEQNAELRRELQRMRGWREAALQLEQKNARLLALNNVRLNPRMTFVTGEVMADSGSPFRRSATVNVGRIDGVTDGAAVMDGLGLVGRIAGVAERSARVMFITDTSSRVPAVIRPSGLRALVAGDNGAAPALDFVDQSDELRPGDQVLTSGDGGLYPPGIVIGQAFLGPDGRQRVRLAADFRILDFVRIARPVPASPIEGPGGLIGPTLPPEGPPLPPSPSASAEAVR